MFLKYKNYHCIKSGDKKLFKHVDVTVWINHKCRIIFFKKQRSKILQVIVDPSNNWFPVRHKLLQRMALISNMEFMMPHPVLENLVASKFIIYQYE